MATPEETPKEIARRLNEQAREAGITPGPPAQNGERPQIKLPTLGREYAEFAREIGQILAVKNVLFRRDLFAFTVNSELQRLDVMEPQRFRTWISDYIEFYVEKTIQDVTLRRAKTMTSDHAGVVLASPQFLDQLPEIRRLHFARQPVFCSDGRIELLRPGFFGEQGIYTLNDNAVIDEGMTIKCASPPCYLSEIED